MRFSLLRYNDNLCYLRLPHSLIAYDTVFFCRSLGNRSFTVTAFKHSVFMLREYATINRSIFYIFVTLMYQTTVFRIMIWCFKSCIQKIDGVVVEIC